MDIAGVVSIGLISVLCFFPHCILLATDSGIKSSRPRGQKKALLVTQ